MASVFQAQNGSEVAAAVTRLECASAGFRGRETWVLILTQLPTSSVPGPITSLSFLISISLQVGMTARKEGVGGEGHHFRFIGGAKSDPPHWSDFACLRRAVTLGHGDGIYLSQRLLPP